MYGCPKCKLHGIYVAFRLVKANVFVCPECCSLLIVQEPPTKKRRGW